MPLLFCSHFINLTDFIAVSSGGHPEASYAQNEKLRSGREGLLRSAHCIVPRSFVLLPSFFFFFTLLSSFYPPLTPILFFPHSFSPSASKWHLSIDCFSDWFACVWPPSFSRAIHRQWWSRITGSWRVDISETVTRGCALIDFPLEWIKSASG